MSNLPEFLFKVCLIGDGGVGKTCLVNRYMTGLFKANSTMTIGVDFHLKSLKIKEKNIALQIWDFAGEERFRFLLPSYINGANCAIFMFDITRNYSLLNINDWIKIIRCELPDIPIIMVGGKLDLHDRRSVFSKDAIELARSYNLYDYIECSAKTGENIELIFLKLARVLLKGVGLF